MNKQHLQDRIANLQHRALNLNKWIELVKTGFGKLLIDDYHSQIDQIRKSYGSVDLTVAGHDLTLAQMQAREQEKLDMLAFLENVEKDKKFIDSEIKTCELQIQQLNSAVDRRSDDVIQPTSEK